MRIVLYVNSCYVAVNSYFKKIYCPLILLLLSYSGVGFVQVPAAIGPSPLLPVVGVPSVQPSSKSLIIRPFGKAF